MRKIIIILFVLFPLISFAQGQITRPVKKQQQTETPKTKTKETPKIKSNNTSEPQKSVQNQNVQNGDPSGSINGQKYIERNEEAMAAVKSCEEAVKYNPSNSENVRQLSDAYASAKMYEKSAESFEKYLGMIEPTINDKFTLGRRYSNAAAMAEDLIAKVQYADKAILYLDEVLKVVPDNFSVANQKAIALYYRNGQEMTQEVVDAFLGAIAILDKDRESNKIAHKNDYVRAYNMIANYYIGEGDKEKAKQYLNLFLEVDPDNQPLRDYVENMK